MNTAKTILLCCLTFFFFSCISEDKDECPPTVNLELTFSYRGDTDDPSMFARCIDQVTLMVYDESERLTLSLNLNKNKLITRQGVDLCLEPGNYKIICWGNTYEHTQLCQYEYFTKGRLHHPFFSESMQIPTNSHLYYGSYTVAVPNKGKIQGDIPFSGAHINVEVYVRDTAMSVTTPDKWVVIEAHNLMPEYNMEMLPARAYTTTYYPGTIFNTEKEVSQTLFQVLNFKDDNPVYIEVKDLSGMLRCNIQLKKYMADHKISVNDKNEATVPILIEFTDLGTEIKLPEWIINEVDPGT